jgi:hypothetical protein
MTTETVRRASCPTCGAKITQAHLSLCAYCGSPLDLGSGRSKVDRATLRRLAAMREHADFAPALAWDPPEGPEARADRRRAALGVLGAASGVVLAGLGAWLALGAGRPLGWVALALGAGLTGPAAVAAAGAARRLRERLALPLMKRPAIVVGRRSETEVAGAGRTTYFFELEFEDGGGEFRYPGRGANHDPLVAGNTGVAYTRRQELLAFHPIRV